MLGLLIFVTIVMVALVGGIYMLWRFMSTRMMAGHQEEIYNRMRNEFGGTGSWRTPQRARPGMISRRKAFRLEMTRWRGREMALSESPPGLRARRRPCAIAAAHAEARGARDNVTGCGHSCSSPDLSVV